jgi:polysaccharide export outer membrane protein
MKRSCLLLCWMLALPFSSSYAAKQPKSKQTTGTPAKPPSDPAAHATGTPAVDTKTYIIGAEDSLFIRVWDSAQVSGPVTVRPDGKVSLLLIGEVQAAGMTPEQLAGKITEALNKYMTHPDVSVAVTQINSKKYFISGEVGKPGAFPLLVPTTVSEALVNAGGFKDFAKTKDIVIIRGNQRFHFNYKDVVIHGKHREQNILLEPGDQIIVP